MSQMLILDWFLYIGFSDGADAFAVNKFLCRVFERSPDASKSMSSINIEPTANELDLKEEVSLHSCWHGLYTTCQAL